MSSVQYASVSVAFQKGVTVYAAVMWDKDMYLPHKQEGYAPIRYLVIWSLRVTRLIESAGVE